VRVLFLHGVGGGTKGPKVQRLEGMPEVAEVRAPNLDYSQVGLNGMTRARRKELVAFAQRELDAFRPDVVVGSSMGARLALNLKTDARLVLIAPACASFLSLGVSFVATNLGCSRFAARKPDKKSPRKVRPGTVILHCPDDGVIGIEISRALATRPGVELREIAFDGEATGGNRGAEAHQMNFPAALNELESVVRDIARAQPR
jgi:hypothetical protein